jgi:hypothetical protein
MDKPPESKCCICHGPLAVGEELRRGWLDGNNAQPVAEGRCCEKCERDVVFPAQKKRVEEGLEPWVGAQPWVDKLLGMIEQRGPGSIALVEAEIKKLSLTELKRLANYAHRSINGKAEYGNKYAVLSGLALTEIKDHRVTKYEWKTMFDGQVLEEPEPDELKNLDYKSKQKDWVQSGVSELIEWQRQPLILQKTKDTTFDSIGSALPIIREMWKAERYFEEAWSEHFTGDIQLFVVSHDWAAAVGGLPGDAYKNTTLPYPHCIFEFLVSGKHICQSVIEKKDGDRSVAAAIKLNSVGWFPIFPPKQFPEISTKIANFLGEQLTAILVTLDAEVTETELVRVPEKLNRAREKRGRHRLSDHHIVKLVPRTRAAPAPDTANTEKRTSPRLHFRRGHWAHYENRKTWRKWALVGDPDLGFVDKHYRL